MTFQSATNHKRPYKPIVLYATPVAPLHVASGRFAALAERVGGAHNVVLLATMAE